MGAVIESKGSRIGRIVQKAIRHDNTPCRVVVKSLVEIEIPGQRLESLAFGVGL